MPGCVCNASAPECERDAAQCDTNCSVALMKAYASALCAAACQESCLAPGSGAAVHKKCLSECMRALRDGLKDELRPSKVPGALLVGVAMACAAMPVCALLILGWLCASDKCNSGELLTPREREERRQLMVARLL